jgi:hypothetical protein
MPGFASHRRWLRNACGSIRVLAGDRKIFLNRAVPHWPVPPAANPKSNAETVISGLPQPDPGNVWNGATVLGGPTALVFAVARRHAP